ncbi:di-trans,poly-cis-decaprenylcistransferase [Candidatus Gracilibacteria bacterium]|nr:di-trans,poly-cis-decaprenylcistransferase [Candidatus Gracilibacteria bacterium]
MNFGLIADGNRRWAKDKNLSLKEGHFNGFLTIRNEIFPVLEKDPDFKSLSIYGFSTENWKRNPLEVKNLMNLFKEIFDGWISELIEKKVRFVHAGRKDRIPKSLAEKLKKAEELSQKFNRFTIYLCLDYGGRDEILRGFEKIENTKNLNEKTFSDFLEVPELDIVVRSGGENRISNFCIWQAAYAEFFFTKKLLPNLKKKDIQKILEQFKNRNRRIGK